MKKLILTILLLSINSIVSAVDLEGRIRKEDFQRQLHKENMEFKKKLEAERLYQSNRKIKIMEKALLTQEMIACALFTQQEEGKLHIAKWDWNLEKTCKDIKQKFEAMLERDLREAR